MCCLEGNSSRILIGVAIGGFQVTGVSEYWELTQE